MLPKACLLLASTSAFLFGSCEDDHFETYERPITSMFYVLTPDSGQKVILSFIDNDGVGGHSALVNSATLKANTTYHGQLMIGMLTTMASPRLEHFIDSTSVAAEPELHQVFFTPMKGTDLRVTYADMDKNGFPIGLETTVQTGENSDGELELTIVHAPNKSGRNVRYGDRSQVGGTLDAEAIFSVKITSVP